MPVHPPRLAVAIICKDNAPTIGRTLDSLRPLAPAVVALDSGSKDATIEMLRAFGAEIRHQPWQGHVQQKQRALEAAEATGAPWILSLDSDESLEPDLAAAVEGVLAAAPADVAGFEVNRKVWWEGRFLHHAWQPEWRLRLVRNGRAEWGGFDPHDQLRLKPGVGRVGRLAGDLRHDSIGAARDFIVKQRAHGLTAARSLRALGRRGSVWRAVTSPMGAWLKQMVLKRAFLDGRRGWFAAYASAVAARAKHRALLELSREGAP
ncbi:MAG: glycosyltransferase family 2 protein [Phycisphaerales bacterium]|nr:glycosyltransferase family 2 protein [Phycisphaerales bacterium]